MTNTYAFSNAAPEAPTQLDCLQHLLDPITTKILDWVQPGHRCWEIGAGNGSIAGWLAGRVGPSGHVLATDINLAQVATASNLRIVEHDITTAERPEAELYDLIHARLVLLHLPERREILARLVGALAPGGRLVLEEFDCARPLTVLAAPDPAAADLFTRVHSGILRALADRGASMTWAYEAYAAMAEAGLEDVESVTNASSAAAESLGALLQEVNSQQLQPVLEGQGRTPAELEDFRALMHDPAFAAMGYTLVSTTGRRPR